MESRIGELAALGTALCWTITAMSFESAGKRIGSFTVNIIRLVMALAIFAVVGLIARGFVIPVDLPGSAWFWLTLSGIVGFVLGDLMLFQAFVEIGARIAMLVYASVPPITALLGRIFLGERLSNLGVLGMALTVAGIALVVLKPAERPSPTGSPRRMARGVLLALGGALGQAGGLILGRIGAGRDLDPFASTQIRVIAGVIGFAILFTLTGRWKRVTEAIRDRGAMARVGTGALFGPFLGVSLGLYAAQNTSAGIASTIMALVPVLIIVPSVVIFREKVTVREIAGAVVAVAGVSLFFV
jgi:drug/metabolite transporter (DMT)-like permease